MRQPPQLYWFLPAALLSVVSIFPRVQAAKVNLTITDQDTGRPTPCRLRMQRPNGKAVHPRGLPFWHDHFVCPGHVELELAPGKYPYEIDRGPEYLISRGTLEVSGAIPIKQILVLKRYANLPAEGWWPGELHVHRRLANIRLLMEAADLYVAPVITWWNHRNPWAKRPLPPHPVVRFDGNRFYDVMGGEDEREGGALMYFNLKAPLDIRSKNREYPSPMKFLVEARQHRGVWIDIEKPFWWDVPVWLASGQVDSIGLANNHMGEDQMYETEAWGKPRDVKRLPPPRGNGFWSQEIYYHILNCGLRLPPSAGSASGVLPNPVGYDRVYVHVDGKFEYEKWWRGLRAGRSFVSNGPLLRCRADGEWPGHVFSHPNGEPIQIKLTAKISTRDPLSSIEIIKNGRVTHTVSFDQWRQTHSLGTLRFDKSGWFLIRTIADVPQTFRFASTAPYYVEIGPVKRRVSRTSARFFLDWVRERMKRIKLDAPTERAEVLQYQQQAEQFWKAKVAAANAP